MSTDRVDPCMHFCDFKAVQRFYQRLHHFLHQLTIKHQTPRTVGWQYYTFNRLSEADLSTRNLAVFILGD